MQYLLDIVGSTIIAGFIMVIVATFNINLTNSSVELISSRTLQREILGVSVILEHDLYKVGYGSPGEIISIADSNQLKYNSDFGGDGVVDTFYYYVGATSEVSQTSNPTDRNLYRKFNTNSSETICRLNKLEFSYFDSLGTVLNYASLQNSAGREKIKLIKVSLRIESPELIDSIYYASAWEETIYPENL